MKPKQHLSEMSRGLLDAWNMGVSEKFRLEQNAAMGRAAFFDPEWDEVNTNTEAAHPDAELTPLIAEVEDALGELGIFDPEVFEGAEIGDLLQKDYFEGGSGLVRHDDLKTGYHLLVTRTKLGLATVTIEAGPEPTIYEAGPNDVYALRTGVMHSVEPTQSERRQIETLGVTLPKMPPNKPFTVN